MTTEKTDPWALLREAVEHMKAVAEDRGPCPDCVSCDRGLDITTRIDAALAAHEAEAADSATPVVEADPWWSPSSHRASAGKCDLHVWRVNLGQWGWTAYIFGKREVGSGFCDTLDEAKAAAIEAARGLK